jgi:glycosyltransferase involved in cell wall biosynthesis
LDGKTGFLSDVGNVEEMANNAIHILEDEVRLNAFKDKALSFSKNFTIEKILPQYEELYQLVTTGYD